MAPLATYYLSQFLEFVNEYVHMIWWEYMAENVLLEEYPPRRPTLVSVHSRTNPTLLTS